MSLAWVRCPSSRCGKPVACFGQQGSERLVPVAKSSFQCFVSCISSTLASLQDGLGPALIVDDNANRVRLQVVMQAKPCPFHWCCLPSMMQGVRPAWSGPSWLTGAGICWTLGSPRRSTLSVGVRSTEYFLNLHIHGCGAIGMLGLQRLWKMPTYLTKVVGKLCS